MNKQRTITLIVIAGLLLWVVYYLVSPFWNNKTLDEASPLSQTTTNTSKPVPVMMHSANLIAGAHDVEGQVLLIDTPEGKVLRFENYKAINGPDLRVYLSTDKTTKDFVDLGPVKATQGNINYSIPEGVDLNKYNHVLVWCRGFSVLFSSAVLQ